MRKRMTIMLICVLTLFALIAAYKLFVHIVIQRMIAANQFPVVTISAMKAEYSEWQPTISVVGNVRATQGINVTTELAGMVRTIHFKPGSFVKKNDLLVTLNIDPDIAQLNVLLANAKLAQITYDRDKAQFKIHAISQQQLDTDFQNLQSATAQVAQEKAIIDKKIIRAPFDGKLGISMVNPGQYLNPGDPIVSLQNLDPIWVDFYIPQQQLRQIKLGSIASIKTDAYPGIIFKGPITTINPAFDADTRNMQIEATIPNHSHQLAPSMFVYVTILAGEKNRFLTLPQTAITFNPYGDLVYVIEESKKDKDPQTKKPYLIASQSFVITGEKRGDQIQILKGLTEGQQVVTSGQLKLKNGSRVKINNDIQPSNFANPITPNER